MSSDMNTRWLFPLLLLSLASAPLPAATDTYTDAGNATWTAPSGVSYVDVQVWGGGGAGGGQDRNSDGGGGGGGGAYSLKRSIAVVAGTTYNLQVGAGGIAVAGAAGGAGGDSYFNNAATVMAKGGSGGSPSTGTPPPGGAGGVAASGVGDIKFSGGAGGRGRNSSTGRGGPGGSSAGTAADGTSGATTWSTLTAAAAPSGGGIGGNGGDTNEDGNAPASGSGGGGGGSGEGNDRRGGNGAPGKVVISYLPCTPPANIPSDISVSCVCDPFGRPSLNPSPIFGGAWVLSNSDGLGNPSINASTGLLHLTDNLANNAKAATAPGIFPAAGNYISVEFRHYAYNGNGADGMAVTLSDYSVPAVPGAYGGSLGYAQKTGINGFAGGWIGVGLDEFGNYSNASEGRVGGIGTHPDSVGVRGPGKGTSGYRWMGQWLGGLAIDSPSATSPAPGSMYQVIVDARASASSTINVSVNRDTTAKDGSAYAALLAPFNAYSEANYAVSQGWISKIVPDYWKISFTGSTGSNTNIHALGALRICAQTVLPSGDGTASGFSAIDEAYAATPVYQTFQTGHIYMKLAGVPFQLWVAALQSAPAAGISVDYSKSSAKYVQVKLVDNSDGVCGSDASRTCSSACTGKAAVETGSGATQIALFPSGASTGVASPSPTFTLGGAYKNLIAVMKECTTSACSAFTSTTAACSADSFSVRPHALNLLPSTASNVASSGTPVFKAGADSFTLNVEAETYNLSASGAPQTLSKLTSYSGTPKVGILDTAPMGSGTWTAGSLSLGTMLAAAVSGVSSNTPTYSEVGLFRLAGAWPKTAGYAGGDDSSLRGVYDGVQSASECASLSTAQCDALRQVSWTGVDGVSTKSDCVLDSFSNLKVDGKYGCNFGALAPQTFGRFIPANFVAAASGGTAACAAGGFSYMGQAFATPLNMTVEARNGSGARTQNYSGSFATGVVSLQMENANSGTAIPAARLNVTNAPAWSSGVYSIAADRFLRAAGGPDGAFDALDIGLAVNDEAALAANVRPYLLTRDMDAANSACTADLTGLSTASEVCSATRLVNGAQVRFGRLWLGNAYGSGVRALALPYEAQYWNGLAFITNTLDSCTALAAANVALGNKQGALTTYAPTPVVSATTTNGRGSITLAAPGASLAGSVDVKLALGSGGTPANCYGLGGGTAAALSYLSGKWCGADYDRDPVARASFGLSGKSRQIFLREGYR